MNHVADGLLRRLFDEPLTVPDRAFEHVRRCRRCQERRDRVVRDAQSARALLVRPQPVPDLERAWGRLKGATTAPLPHVPKRVRPRRLVGSAGAVAVAGVLVAGIAAAATLTVVFSPTHVAPVPVSTGDLDRLASALGLGGSGLFGRHSSPPSTGSSAPGPSTSPSTWAYGTIRWATQPKLVKTTSLAAAESAAGMTVDLPATLPAGVEGGPRFLAVASSSVTVTFGAAAGPALDGSVLTVTLGPGVLAEYGATTLRGILGGVPAFAVATVQRPTATSTGATVAQLEAFVLTRPGFPPDVAEQIRLLGNLKDVLPVPVPSGVTETTTSVAGSAAVVLTAAGGAASAVVWEHDGVVRTVGGFVDQQDVMNVARQLG